MRGPLQTGGLVAAAAFLGLLIAKQPVIDDAADWRSGLGNDLDEIGRLRFGQRESFTDWHHPQLFAVYADHTHFRSANFLVDAYPR